MIAPDTVLRLLFSNRTYDDIMPRFVGILMVAIALIVSQIVRFSAEPLYPMTVLIRLVIWIYVLWLYFHSGDSFFLAVLGVLGLGIVLTGATYLSERAQTRARASR